MKRGGHAPDAVRRTRAVRRGSPPTGRELAKCRPVSSSQGEAAMMNRRNPDRIFRWAGALVPALAALMSVGLAQSGQRADLAMALKGPFNLGAARTAEVHYFRMITQFIHIGFDGKRTGVETYTLTLKCVPAALAAQDGDAYTCRDFRLRFNDAPEATIPALAGWTHLFKPGGTGTGEAGQVFGIPHAKFENLVDSRGRKLPVGIGYAVCNSFIDFHAFNDVFARPTEGGKGIQDLTEIGQRIVHAAAFTEPPVNLGSGIKTGSVFRNGEVTLEFKGPGACGRRGLWRRRL
jgi:hypothetical protein